MPSRTKARRQLLFERRVLFSCTILVGLSLCVWAVAIGTDYWLTARPPADIAASVGIPIGDPNAKNGTKYFLGGHTGLFKVCTHGSIDFNNGTKIPYNECKPHDLIPPDDFRSKTKLKRYEESDGTLVNYARTDVSFGIISVFVMVMGFGFSIYTFRNPRYMFKRLAGGIHFITSACTMVVIQVLLGSKDYGSKSDKWIFPKSVDISYGYSIVLAWFVFAANLLSGLSFMWFSKKRKGNPGNDEFGMADEPTIIGR